MFHHVASLHIYTREEFSILHYLNFFMSDYFPNVIFHVSRIIFFGQHAIIALFEDIVRESGG